MSDEHNIMIKQFMNLTGCCQDFSEGFLKANDWNIEFACSNFFDVNKPSDTLQVDSLNPSHAKDEYYDEKVVLKTKSKRHLNKLDTISTNTSNFIDSSSSFDKNSSKFNGTNCFQVDDGPSIRSPIPPSDGVLLETDLPILESSLSGFNTHVSFRNLEYEARLMEAQMRQAILGQMQKQDQYPNHSLFHNPILKNSTKDPNIQSNATNFLNSPPENTRERNLQSLFQPPRNLLFIGSFDSARTRAHHLGKWILVNIQEDSEFLCYQLNRDLWQNEIIQQVIQENFIFFQHNRHNQAGINYIRLYGPTSFPHIAIIDPRTGEKMLTVKLNPKIIDDPLELRTDFLNKISNFLLVNKFEPSSENNTPDLLQSNSNLNDKAIPTEKCELTQKPHKLCEPIHDDRSNDLIESKEYSYPKLEPEPDVHQKNVTKVRLRLFDGKTVNRSFRIIQKISQLFAFVYSIIPETKTRPFTIITSDIPPKDLLNLQDKLFEEENINHSSLKCRWL